MDNLTHTLTGILLARAGLERFTPRAAWIAGLAANVPDIDIVTLAGGGGTYFTYHRAATHAIVMAPIMALIPVLLVAGISRTKLPWLRSWLVSLVAVASHLLLDYTNPYGIRLWLPFSDAWPALDSTSVIDIWIWTFLLVACLWPILSGLVSSEIGSKGRPGRASAIAGLLAVALYDSSRYVLHQRALETLQSRIYDGEAPRHTVVFPRIANPLHWDGWVETEKSWQSIEVDLSTEFDPQPRNVFWKPEPHPSVAVASRLPIFQVLLRFARTPYWRITPAEDRPGAQRLELMDLRFAREGRTGFTATATVDESGRVLDSGFHL